MAIKWLDAKRLQGTNAERTAMETTEASTPTKSKTQFAAGTWTSQGDT